MTEWIKKHKKAVARTLGILLLVGGIAALYWEKGNTLSEQNKAAQENIKRMEAALPYSVKISANSKENKSPIMKAYLAQQRKHLRYLVIIAIIAGVIFLGYGFIKKKDDGKTD